MEMNDTDYLNRWVSRRAGLKGSKWGTVVFLLLYKHLLDLAWKNGQG